MDNILKIFSTEDKNEMKQCMKNIIIERFKEDLEQNSCYIFDVNELESMCNDVFEEVKEELKEEYKSKIKTIMNEKFEKFIKTIQ